MVVHILLVVVRRFGGCVRWKFIVLKTGVRLNVMGMKLAKVASIHCWLLLQHFILQSRNINFASNTAQLVHKIVHGWLLGEMFRWLDGLGITNHFHWFVRR